MACFIMFHLYPSTVIGQTRAAHCYLVTLDCTENNNPGKDSQL